jgi:hypothetical protein
MMMILKRLRVAEARDCAQIEYAIRDHREKKGPLDKSQNRNYEDERQRYELISPTMSERCALSVGECVRVSVRVIALNRFTRVVA